MSETWPACSAPMVGTRPTVRPVARAPSRRARQPAAVSMHVHGRHPAGDGSERDRWSVAGVAADGGGEAGRQGGTGLVAGALGLGQRIEVPAERGPVAPARRAGEGGACAPSAATSSTAARVSGRKDSRSRPTVGGDALDLAEQRHDVVRRDAGGGVVGGTVLVGDLDRAAAEGGGDLAADRRAGHGEGDARAQPGRADLAVGQRHERVHGRPARVGAERVEAEGAREVHDGGGHHRHHGGRHLGDGVVGGGDDEHVDAHAPRW